jgi:hypothetical protein
MRQCRDPAAPQDRENKDKDKGKGPDAASKPVPSSSRDTPKPGMRKPSAILYFGGVGAWGSLPGIAGGGDLGGGLRWPNAAVRLGVRYDFPADLDLSSGRIETRELLGQAAVCLGRRWGFGCAGVSLGAVLGRGGRPRTVRKGLCPRRVRLCPDGRRASGQSAHKAATLRRSHGAAGSAEVAGARYRPSVLADPASGRRVGSRAGDNFV